MTISTRNSSNIPLGVGETFTGTARDVRGYTTVTTLIFTDVDSAVGGLVLEFSSDATNWDVQNVRTLVGGQSTVAKAEVVAQFFRVTLTNGDTPQTVLRLSTQLNRDVEEMSEEEAGITTILKFGSSPTMGVAVTPSAPQDVWQGAGVYTGQPVGGAAETVEIFSSNAADTAAGTGARTVSIAGLDDNLFPQTENLTLNGVTAVTSVGLYRRLFRVIVLTAGSGGENAGVLTVRHTTTIANVFAQITAGYNQTQIAGVTVPANKRGRLVSIDISVRRLDGSAGSVEGRVLIRPPGGVYNAIRVFELQTRGGLYSPELQDIPVDLVPGTDVLLRVTGVSDDNTRASGSFGIKMTEEVV